MTIAMNRSLAVAATTAAFVFVAWVALAQDKPGLKADMIDASGKSIGSAMVEMTASGQMHLVVEATGIPAGEHGFHVHETGVCDGADGFKSAGGHLAGGKEHGVKAEGGAHVGDMPNVTVGEGGMFKAEVFKGDLTMEQVADADGSAIIIHAKADDYTSQPAGDAGDRIACAVLKAQ